LLTPRCCTVWVMNPRAKQISAALGAALALAFGAYALGAQSDDGSASASRNGAPPAVDRGYGPGPGLHKGPRAGLQDLAKQLGVTQAKLHAALEDIRKEQRTEVVKKLAQKLGVPESKVKAALPEHFPGGPPDGRRHFRMRGGSPPPPPGPPPAP
jgi:hypothetical protein